MKGFVIEPVVIRYAYPVVGAVQLHQMLPNKSPIRAGGSCGSRVANAVVPVNVTDDPETLTLFVKLSLEGAGTNSRCISISCTSPGHIVRASSYSVPTFTREK